MGRRRDGRRKLVEPRLAERGRYVIEVEVRNPIGAGDAFLGGLLSWLEVGWSFPEAVRWGMATACAAIGQWSPGAASAEDAARYHARLTPAESH